MSDSAVGRIRFGLRIPGWGGAGPLVMARLVSAGVTFFIPLVLARAMNLDQYGTYKQVFLIATVLYQVLPAGMPQALFYFVPRADHRRPFYVHTLVFLLLIGGGMSWLLVALLGAPVAGLFSNPELLECRWALTLYVIGLIASYPLEISLTSQGQRGWAAVAYLGSDALRVVAMIGPVLLGFGLAGMLWGLVAFVGLRVLVTFAVLVAGSRGPLWDKTLLRQQIVHAAPFGAAVLIAVPQQYAHQFAVSATVAPELFAIYAVGCFQLPIVDVLYTPTSEILMVRIGQLDRSGRMREAVEALRAATARLAFAFLPLATFLFLAAPDLIALAFGQKFLAATPLFRLAVVGILVSIVPVDGVLRATNATRHIFRSRVVKAVITVPALLIGLHAFGMFGAMMAWALAEVVGKWVMLRRVPQVLGRGNGLRDVLDMLPRAELGRAAAASLLAAVVMLGLGALVPVPAADATFTWRASLFGGSAAVFALSYVAALRLSRARASAMGQAST